MVPSDFNQVLVLKFWMQDDEIARDISKWYATFLNVKPISHKLHKLILISSVLWRGRDTIRSISAAEAGDRRVWRHEPCMICLVHDLHGWRGDQLLWSFSSVLKFFADLCHMCQGSSLEDLGRCKDHPFVWNFQHKTGPVGEHLTRTPGARMGSMKFSDRVVLNMCIHIIYIYIYIAI